jgi:copper homeostasis protein
MKDPVLVEVCANSVASALAAQDGGALRVELCENLYEGGTTPSYGQVLIARKLLNIKLYVLIRPRSGDFLYSEIEFDIMKADVQFCADSGCDGVVIGILNADGSVDKERCAKLVSIAKQNGLGVTFHRAFDMANDQFQAMEDIIDLGCERILTSGGKTTAIEGCGKIANLIKKARGRVIIMPGSGVNENNVTDLINYTSAKEVHLSARSRVQSKMVYLNDHILMDDRNGNEYTIDVTDANRVKQVFRLANNSFV